MNLLILNGSPRGKKSNTTILMERFLEGFTPTGDHTVDIRYLNDTAAAADHAAAFKNADAVILAMPLYTDAMPGIVKHFIEELKGFDGEGEKILGFVIQSGFPEGIHCAFLEKYLAKLAKRLNCRYAGTVLKGGVEGIQVKSPRMNKKLFAAFTALGEKFAAAGRFDPAIVSALRKPYLMPGWVLLLARVLRTTGLLDFYWKSQLKKHNALDKALDRPYA